MALGTRRWGVLKLILNKGVVLAGVGISAGMIFSAATASVMASLLYGVRPHDLVVFLIAQSQSQIRVLVVWETMLPTDWSRPSGMVQARLSDSRVVQFWDKEHLVARELRQQLSSSQICCQRNGILWDIASLYPRDTQWGASPAFFGGAVLDVAGNVRQHLSSMSSGRRASAVEISRFRQQRLSGN